MADHYMGPGVDDPAAGLDDEISRRMPVRATLVGVQAEHHPFGLPAGVGHPPADVLEIAGVRRRQLLGFAPRLKPDPAEIEDIGIDSAVAPARLGQSPLVGRQIKQIKVFGQTAQHRAGRRRHLIDQLVTQAAQPRQYPGEYHTLKKPSHKLDRYARMRAWFAHYLQ